jgi:hypothetical protein
MSVLKEDFRNAYNHYCDDNNITTHEGDKRIYHKVIEFGAISKKIKTSSGEEHHWQGIKFKDNSKYKVEKKEEKKEEIVFDKIEFA